MINSPVLVLNKFFFPIDTTNVKRAFLMLYGGAAKAVNLNYETFDLIHGAKFLLLMKKIRLKLFQP